MDFLKKSGAMLLMFMAVIGCFGGFGYACYIHEYVTAVCILVLGVLAAPTVVRLFKYMTDQ